MKSHSRAGRPRASSRATLAEAACELFLERGYEATSIADITQRAGVSRSSFFNYFASKADVLWGGLDARIDRALDQLRSVNTDSGGDAVRAILAAIITDFAPDALALALRNADAMGLTEELERDTGLRHARLAAGVASAARRGGIGRMRADILGAAYAAAVLSSVRVWAEQGAGLSSLESLFEQALVTIHDLPWRD